MKYFTLAVLFVTVGFFSSCSSDTTPTPNGGNGSNQNYDAYWKYTLKGNQYESRSFLADYGAKIYVSGLDGDGNLLVDFAIPVQKDKLLSNNPIALSAGQSETKGIVYIGSDQWGIANGKISVTKHENNRISGTFSGKAYQLDYTAGNDPELVDSAEITGGIFNDIPVNDQ